MDWIIGGTKDSRDFIKLLSEKNINLKNIILTTVSDYGKKLAEESGAAVKSGAMNKDEMKSCRSTNYARPCFNIFK